MKALTIPLPEVDFLSEKLSRRRRELAVRIARFNEKLPALSPAEAARAEFEIRRELAGFIPAFRRECHEAAYRPDTVRGSWLYEEARRAHHDVRPTENQLRLEELRAALAC